MLRPDKKHSVYDLRQLKGKRCLTHIHVKSPPEAAAAEAAGIDLLSCSFDTAESQARLPLLVAAAPKELSFRSHPARAGFDGRGDPGRISGARTRRELGLLLRQPLDDRSDGAEIGRAHV